MRVLAFDCSTSVGSVAVLEDGGTRMSESFACPRGRGGEFFAVLERAVRLGRPDRIAVGIGPGSYNGLRTAITAAEGLALTTGAERVGILSVRAIPCDAAEYLAISDARGGSWSFARIRDRRLVGAIEMIPAASVRERLDVPAVFAPAPVEGMPDVRVATPCAVEIAKLAMLESPATGLLEPFYLKPAHITQPKPRS